MNFKAFWVEEMQDGSFSRSIVERSIESLDTQAVLIKVLYSALNYKDALSASGHKGITRNYPHTPGIDAAGVIERSSDPRWKAGEPVLVTGYDLGMDTDGGFGQFVSVPAEWVVAKPQSLDLKSCAALGTAAFTAALAVYKMEINGQSPEHGPVLVTGATGAVGSMAVRFLSLKGYPVIASTGKKQSHSYLTELGASECIPRFDAEESPEKPLLRSRWAGVIDTVGGATLATAIRACKAGGNVAVCGLVQSPFFTLNVYPFIIKDINVLGVASAETPYHLRQKIWQELETHNPLHPSMLIESDLSSLDSYIQKMLAGGLQGRVLIDLWK
jgi:putative YhdH/YhfP family quinone oxidoreductase